MAAALPLPAVQVLREFFAAAARLCNNKKPTKSLDRSLEVVEIFVLPARRLHRGPRILRLR